MMYKQNGNISKEAENLKRNSKAEKYNNWNEKFTKRAKGRLEQAGKRISKLEDRKMDIIESKEHRDWRKVTRA